MTNPHLDTIEVRLDDGPRQLPSGSTVHDLIVLLGVPTLRATVAVDGHHVPRAHWMSHRLEDGQHVLLFQPIVGG